MIRGWFYRALMKVAHRYHWHYAPPIYPEGDTQLWCKWCGFRQTIKRAGARSQVAELEAENKQLKEWAGRSLVMSDYPNAEAMRTEIESMRPVMEAAKRHAKYNELIGKSFCTCDICTSYRDYEAKKP